RPIAVNSGFRMPAFAMGSRHPGNAKHIPLCPGIGNESLYNRTGLGASLPEHLRQ
ncbi:hypothetical protein M404DRAFT_1001591, partial [Pisolithus tinctorius Marx 270]